MLEFLKMNWLTILIVLLAVGYIVYLFVTKQWAKIRELAYKSMLKLERTYIDSQGPQKFDTALNTVWLKLPFWIRLFISKEDITVRLQSWYDKAKDFLDDGQINDSIIDAKIKELSFAVVELEEIIEKEIKSIYDS